MLKNKKTPLEIFEEIASMVTHNEELKAKLKKLKETKINILLVGGTGVGKSSTINALFDMEQAKVGRGANPETTEIEKYELKNIVLWDTPGLGDSTEKDKKYAEMIKNKLQEKDANGDALIDIVLLLVNASHRDMGSTYTILKDIIIPNLISKDSSEIDRLVIGVNQADSLKNGRLWNYETNEPTSELVTLLDEKVESVKARIKEDSNIDCDPIYFAAGDKDCDVKPFNISKLSYILIDKLKTKKRTVFLEDRSKQEENFTYSDNKKDYNQQTKKSAWSAVIETVGDLAKPVIDFLSSPEKREKALEVIKGGIELLSDIINIFKTKKR